MPPLPEFSAIVWGLVTVHGSVIALALAATLAGRDLWPFSHYPMFAGRVKGTAVRFFRLRARWPDGRSTLLRGEADALVDPFHRECEQLWTEGTPATSAADELALRAWNEASAIDPHLASAGEVEIVLQLAQVIAGEKILVAGKVVHVVPTTGRPAV